ncbi:hypothetical protein AVEN_41769-1 [Araneus ventricosus]|uniref:Low-density lipoprotein receptor-related protein 2 n=1 Tax=Araneus ventricosus TaxID=182803 RepID=A0A4Y2ADM9_ARAVE|nr:hypothetical protein AVEN_41769-1 [Araneus ventricosus]
MFISSYSKPLHIQGMIQEIFASSNLYCNSRVLMWCLWLLIIPGVTGYSLSLSMVKCDINQFPCNNGESCFYKYHWCDGNYYCPDATDESYCSYQNECPIRFFRCDNGLCVPESGRCDGYPSCPDGSDEFDCGM